jgi:hypothetical protein
LSVSPTMVTQLLVAACFIWFLCCICHVILCRIYSLETLTGHRT